MSAHGIRGIEYSEILEAVRQVEISSQKLEQQKAALNQYVKLGSWLIQARYAGKPQLLPCLKDMSPLVDRSLFARIKRKLKTLNTIHAACNADLICVKHHIRAFYCQPRRYTARIAMHADASEHKLKKELEILRQVRQFGCINVPAIHETGQAGPHAYLVEDLIDGEPVTYPADLQLLNQLAMDLWQNYLRFGLETAASDSYIEEGTSILIDDALEKTVWNPAWGSKQDFLDTITRLIGGNSSLLCGVGHGNLSLGNMIKHDNRIHVLDWEYAGETPIAFDVAKLLLQVPELGKNYTNYIESEMLRMTGSFTPFPVQMAYGWIKRLARLAALMQDAEDKERLAKRLALAVESTVKCFRNAG